MQQLTTDVAIVGSGAGGAAVAGQLWRAGMDVTVIEAGRDRFADGVVHSRNLHPMVRDDPAAGAIIDREWVYPCGSGEPVPGFPGYRVSHGLGGMTALWTANCPTPLDAEVTSSQQPRKFDDYLERARRLLTVGTSVNGASRRGQRILDTVAGQFERYADERPVQHMPVAIRWAADRPHYASSGELLANDAGEWPSLRFGAVCQRLNARDGRVESVDCSTEDGTGLRVSASTFVLASGGLSIPQLIHTSGLDVGPAIGRYMTDHMITTTQICLKPPLLADIAENDPPFSVWIPASERRPWQSEVFRHPQAPAPARSPRDMADVCSFSRIQPRPDNRVRFAETATDAFGLPRPIVDFTLSDADLAEFEAVYDDNIRIARLLAVPEAGMRCVVGGLGSAGHLMGTCRSGETDDGTSVTDSDGRFWRVENLYAAGLSVLGAANACNPTLTCVAHGLRTADAIKRKEHCH